MAHAIVKRKKAPACALSDVNELYILMYVIVAYVYTPARIQLYATNVNAHVRLRRGIFN